MEHVTKMVPFLWDIIGRNKKGAINVTTKENEIIVSIWSGRRWKRYKDNDIERLKLTLCHAFGLQ